MTILKSRAHILFAALALSGSVAFLGSSAAHSEAKGKMDWPKHFTKMCESTLKDQMDESELESRCYYHMRPGSTGSAYAAKVIGEPIIAPASAEPCIKTLVKYHERQCPVD